MSLSADGTIRAKTIYNREDGCVYATSNTGGVFLEQRTPSGWVSDGSLTAPALGTDLGARWASCSYFGTVTQLSADGSTLLVSPEASSTFNPELGSRYRCAAFVYQHGASGWERAGTLFPPGVTAQGSTESTACEFFGIGGAISADGTRVAVLSDGRVDVFASGTSGWSLEQNIVLPQGPGCNEAIGPKQIALSGDGATLLVGDPDCETEGKADSGRVYAYTRSGSSWSLAQTIESPETLTGNEFGDAVAISGDGSTAAINIGGAQAFGLVPGAGAAWIYAHEAGGWQRDTRLTAPTPEAGQYFSCPTIVENASRIICGTVETVGSDSQQGTIYLFERPGGGWTSPSPSTRLFALEGSAGDELGLSGRLKWKAFAAAANGTEIDATISPENLANGTYPNDRMGYEFAASGSFTTTITSFSPPAGVIGSSVTITGTDLTGASAVDFNGVPASSYSVESPTRIIATVPAGATNGPISLTTPNVTATSAEDFTVLSTLHTTASGPILAGGQLRDVATLSVARAPPARSASSCMHPPTRNARSRSARP